MLAATSVLNDNLGNMDLNQAPEGAVAAAIDEAGALVDAGMDPYQAAVRFLASMQAAADASQHLTNSSLIQAASAAKEAEKKNKGKGIRGGFVVCRMVPSAGSDSGAFVFGFLFFTFVLRG